MGYFDRWPLAKEWDESRHPRGKTTPQSNDGSFAPAGLGPYGNAEVRVSKMKNSDFVHWLGGTAGSKYGNPDFVAWQFGQDPNRKGRATLQSLTYRIGKEGREQRQAAAKDLLVRVMEEGKKHGITTFDLREHYDGKLEEDEAIFDSSHPNHDDYAWVREFVSTDPRLMSVNGSYLVRLYDEKAVNTPVSIESYAPSMKANFVTVSHGTRADDWAAEKALDAGGVIHVGTDRAARERVGLAYSSTGFATFGIDTSSGKASVHTLTVDARTIDHMDAPQIEDYHQYMQPDRQKELSAKGIYGVAYVNRVEDPDSVSLMLWDKRALKKT